MFTMFHRKLDISTKSFIPRIWFRGCSSRDYSSQVTSSQIFSSQGSSSQISSSRVCPSRRLFIPSTINETAHPKLAHPKSSHPQHNTSLGTSSHHYKNGILSQVAPSQPSKRQLILHQYLKTTLKFFCTEK